MSTNAQAGPASIGHEATSEEQIAPAAFARRRAYWVQLGWGVLVSVLSAFGMLLFVTLMNLGIAVLWPQEPGPEPFSGSVRILVIMTIAGLIVGLIHRFIMAQEADVFGGMVKGRLDPRPVPGALLVALVSLVGGFSLGPEVPTGMLGSGLATWLSERNKLEPEVRRSNVTSGVLSAYGGLFTSPFAVLLAPLELSHQQIPGYYGFLSIAAIAAVIGFSLIFAIGRDSFASVIRLLDLPAYDLALWHLLAAVVLGVFGAFLGLVFGLLLRTLKRLASPLNSRPILRSTLGGFLLGLLGMALPLTLFLGTSGLEVVTSQGAQIGFSLLILLAFAKLLATTGAFSTGFIGGPIFPLLFVGGTFGMALQVLFPQIPVALAVAAMMAAVPASLLPIPLSLSLIVLLIVGAPADEAIPVVLAALTAYFLTHGLGLLGPKKGQDAKKA